MWRGFAGQGYLSDQLVVRRAAVTYNDWRQFAFSL